MKASKPTPGLYIVATPIGNLRDMTFRAVDTLMAADVIACEDTRVTAKLLSAYEIGTATVAYHEHNAAKMRPVLLDRLRQGEIVALVSDAGTPLISDPGYKLVRAAVDSDIAVTSLPGASAPITALAAAGLPTDRFLFAGFLPSRTAARRRALSLVENVSATLVFFESARRLAASLQDMHAVLGLRQAVVARELTKRFEEFRRGSLDTLADHYAAVGPPKGEIVVLIAPADESAAQPEDLDALLRDALDGMSVRDAAATVSAATGRPRREVYARALELDRTG
ncbi:MAG: 16S rRNA (cytidine(1402)-2'-O)-methyltransferase [Rhodospirillaceae bacterium]|nr:16S rRNA (cytidine(1402)-2'-O)-methyltransferase [Rhodospirillaceae bacterium]MDD9929784.1 16S rRNA (cytidine(1402)-2'-O)-methyltransferase [Rhodospirillaceae bacterium]